MKLTTVTLSQPIKRGKDTIKTVQLRCPKAGELRGLSLLALINLHTDAICEVVPRVSEPALTKAEMHNMSPLDALELGAAVAEWLAPDDAKAAAEAAPQTA